MTLRDTLSPLNIALVLGIAIATIVGFVLVPAGMELPIHWGIDGAADRYMPRDGALLLLPTIALAVVALLLVVMRFSSEQRRQAARYAIGVTISALLALFLAIQIATVMIGTGAAVDMVRIVVLGVGLLFVVLGNIMPKTQPNWVAGIRLPWTVADARNWQATHRLGGLLMMAGGVAIAGAALLTGQPYVLLAITAVGALLPLIIAGIYSYNMARTVRAG